MKMAVDKLDFSASLLHWYRRHQRRLPWRKTQDPYRIWISEIMLQQTTVQAVLPYYEKWLLRFPDIETLSRSPLQLVLKTWQGLGYYQRAKNIHNASRIFMARYQGKIPADFEVLKRIPGFGPYTTAAVLSIAFDKPYPAIDANVRRIWLRLMGQKKEASPRVDPAIRKYMAPFVPETRTGLFNQAVMELGALVCRSKNPLCLLCPVTAFCAAFAKGEQEVIPSPKKRHYRDIEAAVAIIKKQGKYLIQKRPSKGLLADLWEFPGGKKEAAETLEEALGREIKEELNADVANMVWLTSVKHAYTQFRVTLHAFLCSFKSLPSLSGKRHRWVSLKNMKNYPFPSGSVKIIQHLEELEKQKGSHRNI